MSQIITYSTVADDPACRLDGWNAFLQSAFPGIVVDGAHDLRGQSKTFILGDLAVSKIHSERATVRRWMDGHALESRGRAKLHIQISGISTTTQRGRTVSLSTGEATFVLSDEPYEMEISNRNEMLVIEFPVASGPDLAIRPVTAIDRTSPVNALLCDMVCSLFKQHWPVEARAEFSALGQSVLPLVSMLRGCSVHSEPPVNSDIRRQIFAYIDANISDSAMRTGQIADSLGVQTRDIQAVFAELATTPTAYIKDRRLSLAAQRLAGSGALHSGLTDLACDLGFSDAAHFCRRFKTRFGVSPGTYARQQSWH